LVAASAGLPFTRSLLAVTAEGGDVPSNSSLGRLFAASHGVKGGAPMAWAVSLSLAPQIHPARFDRCINRLADIA
jgi:hypothetical protein